MKQILDYSFTKTTDFFEPVQEANKTGSSDHSAGFIIFLMFVAFVSLCLYGMNSFAESGIFGAVGLGIILFIAWAMPIIVHFAFPGTRIRGFVLSAIVVTVFFLFFVDYTMKNSKHPHNTVHQQAFEAMR